MTEKDLNKNREELLAWFRKAAPHLVETYELAIRAFEDPRFPDRVLVIAHAVREINNTLPEVLDSSSKRNRLEYRNHLDDISSEWPSISLVDAKNISEEATVSIKIKTALRIDCLIEEHRKERDNFAQFDILFKILTRAQPSRGDINSAIVRDFKNTHGIFVRWSKKRTLIDNPPTESDLIKCFRKFENTLYSFVGNFFESLKKLDELLKTGIQPEQIDEAIPLIASPGHEEYFFNNLSDPRLIPALAKMGIFNNPFKTEVLEEGGLRYPPWPPSRYLARMADSAPDEIGKIFSKMDTDNPSVVRDIIHASLLMPVQTASKLVPKISKFSEDKLLVLSIENAADLCVKLAEGGESRSAEQLAVALFAPQTLSHRNSWEEYQYGESLSKAIPALAARLESTKFLKSLCGWLHYFIEDKKHSDLETGADYSHLWRPAIENHGENHDYDFAGPMVAFVTDAFELAIGNKRLSLEAAFKILDRQNYLVFERIKLHLINKFAEQDPGIAKAAILNPVFFKKCEYKHEYAKLVESRFSLLDENERQEWFSLVENGPDAGYLKDPGSSDSEELAFKKKRYWKYGKLHWAREYLNGSHKTVYEAMEKEFGNLLLPDLNIRSYSGMVGSPIASETLSKLSFKEAVKTVAEWQPSGHSLSGIEELAGAFQEYASGQPEDFSKQAKELIGRPAIFSAKFISAMCHAVKSGREIDIGAVLDLCQWAISCFDGDADTEADKYWNWARSEIALFIKAVCQAAENNFPKYSLLECRSRLWEMISCLCRMKEDAVFLTDSGSDPRSEDYIQIGINSLKGQAMEASLEYARWIFNHFKQQGTNADGAELAEVLKLLETHMSAEDRTPGEMAMIGSNIHLLYALDKAWLKEHAGSIFPLGSAGSSSIPSEWAAWNAFLLSSHPHIEFYKIFEKQFVYAVQQAPSIQAPKNGSAYNPVQRLGEHLAVLYMRGELPLDDERLSLRKFIAETASNVGRHTVEFIGKVLENHSAVPEDVIKRCMKLWELYWADKGREGGFAERGGWPFESWIGCRKFPKDWCLEQFENYLQTVENPEISSWAMEELAWASEADLKKTVGILDAAIRGDREGFHIPGWQEPIYAILEASLKEDSACSKSRKLADYLGRSGYMKFRGLVF